MQRLIRLVMNRFEVPTEAKRLLFTRKLRREDTLTIMISLSCLTSYTGYPNVHISSSKLIPRPIPFVEDSEAYWTETTWEQLLEDNMHTHVVHLFEEMFLEDAEEQMLMRFWIFLLGDKERCQKLLNNAPTWEYEAIQGFPYFRVLRL